MTDSNKSLGDIVALSISTLGVGYLPLAPGTFGSIVGVGAYLAVASFFADFAGPLVFACLGLGMIAICVISFLASKRTAELMDGKDPQIVVVDEFAGQLLAFAFIPLTLSWKYVLAGFLLFRLFDIWKPYPIRYFEEIPAGIGIVADDLVAGVYAGVVLSFLVLIL